MTGQAAAVADPEAREFLRKADPVLARIIDAHPDFRPRAWLDDLPALDGFGQRLVRHGVAGKHGVSQRPAAGVVRNLARIEERPVAGLGLVAEVRMPEKPRILAADPAARNAAERSAGLRSDPGLEFCAGNHSPRAGIPAKRWTIHCSHSRAEGD